MLRKLRIGDVVAPNNLVLSPMAGFTDLAFRRLCRRHGAGIVSTEQVGVSSFTRGAYRSAQRARLSEEDQPVMLQLIGTDPAEAARAAREVTAAEEPDLLGFNMGCPAFQVQRAGCGAALLDRPEAARAIVRAVKEASDRPLVVKMRLGNGGPIDAVGFARNLEASGADALIVHGRMACQGYSGRADWESIRRIVEALSIPVLANGDVVDGPSAERCLAATGAAGVAIGRASLGDPRIFGRVAAHLAGAPAPPATHEALLAERLADLGEYLRLAAEADLPPTHVLKQAQAFTRGLPGASRIRAALTAETLPAAERVVREMGEARLRVPA